MAVRSTLGRWRVGYAGTSCPRCKAVLGHEDIRVGEQACRTCGGLFEAVRFDPVKPVVAVPLLAGIGPDGGAPCARHARNQAVASCGRCGQFMCSLCRIDADGQAYCPPCFDRLSTEGSIPGGAVRLRNYRGMAVLCLLPSFSLIFSFLAPISGSLGTYFSIRGIGDKKKRKEEDGVVPLYIILMLNVLGVLGGIAWWGLMFMGSRLGAGGR